MTKKVIAIISVLKPVDDTRNYEKVARSISNTNKYETNIIGFSTKKIPSNSNITFYPIFNFNRISLGRSLAQIKIFSLLLKLKPELIIVTCAELLIVSILYKILFGCKIIYDMQENYHRNIRYSGAYPHILKHPIAWLISTLEWLSSPFIDKCFLAENIYAQQLRRCKNKSVVIENKAVIPSALINSNKTKNQNIVFVYSGTISEHYGIFDAVDFIIHLKSKLDNVRLVIIGYAAQPKIHHKLMKITEGLDYIKIIGGDELVPHDQILIEMHSASFCLLPYQENKSVYGRIPTKLYECLSMEIPVIINPNGAWDALIKQNNAGINFNFQSSDPFPIDLLDGEFYGNNMASNYSWNSIEPLLLEAVKDLIP